VPILAAGLATSTTGGGALAGFSVGWGSGHGPILRHGEDGVSAKVKVDSVSRLLGRAFVVGMLVALALLGRGALVPDNSEAAGEPIYACAKNATGQLRLLGGSGQCARGETRVNLNNAASPVRLCVLTGSGQLRFANRCAAN